MVVVPGLALGLGQVQGEATKEGSAGTRSWWEEASRCLARDEQVGQGQGAEPEREHEQDQDQEQEQEPGHEEASTGEQEQAQVPKQQ